MFVSLWAGVFLHFFSHNMHDNMFAYDCPFSGIVITMTGYFSIEAEELVAMDGDLKNCHYSLTVYGNRGDMLIFHCHPLLLLLLLLLSLLLIILVLSSVCGSKCHLACENICCGLLSHL